MRAGLSIWREFCKCLVSVGAGLPTQRVSRRCLILQGCYEHLSGIGGNLSFELPEFGYRHCSKVNLHRRHLRTNLSLELSSFVRRHQSEEGL